MERGSVRLSNKLIKSISISVIVGELMTFLTMLIASIIIVKGNLSLSLSFGVVTFCSIISGFIAGFICGILMREKGLLYGALCGVILCMITFALVAFFGGFSGEIFKAARLLIIPLFSAIGGLLGVNKKKRRNKY